MRASTPRVLELLADLQRIVARVPSDFGGGCPLAKSFIMAHLALTFDLKNYVEIGVYRGRSFFPMAYATQKLGGMAYGIDPYDSAVAAEYDLEPEFGRQVNSFLESLDLSRIHEEVNRLRDELGFADSTQIIRERSVVAADVLGNRKVVIDLLHIDGNHDTRHVMEDIELYLPLVREGGFVVLDDTAWASVKPGLNRLKNKLDVVFNNGRFAIFSKAATGGRVASLERRRLQILHDMVENLGLDRAVASAHDSDTQTSKVSVIVFTYNHEKYVAECMEGILAQKGDFRIELVIGDDCSTDSTPEVIRAYVDNLRDDTVEVKVLASDRNLGFVGNLKRCLEACTGRYITVCEGDDFWIDSHKLQVQMDFLRQHPECALCFHDIDILSQENGAISAFVRGDPIAGDVLTTKDLIRENFIGNFSCCMYDAQYIRSMPAGLFDLPLGGEWMFNIYCSQLGDIGYIGRVMSVYRRHAGGIWSGKPSSEKAKLLLGYIDQYNSFLDYEFDREFCAYQEKLRLELSEEPIDIAIIDDVFPHPLSAFRMQEFESYLKEFARAKIYTTGSSVALLGEDTIDELVTEFKRRHPEDAARLTFLERDTVINARLIYMVFLGNTAASIDRIERLGTPFVFTLYPGGAFGLNSARSDALLRRVTDSPCFRKVIVTQKVTYDYLIDRGFCVPEQIEFIFGVVTPITHISDEYPDKKHFGIDKGTLDICFVAHRYTARGIDKGYDVFIDVARELSRKYDNIQFHVVGGFDENDIDVQDISERIAFYGRREMDWFDEFYRDKDIILSPNVPFKVLDGAFDGFPTGACVDAAFRKTAIFATDELQLNTHFVDGEDLLILPPVAAEIVGAVEVYYREPDKLRGLAESGYRRMRQLYSYEAQVVPRVKLLREQVALAASGGTTLGISVKLWRSCPASLQSLMRTGVEAIRSHEGLFRVIKRVCPELVMRLYRKIRASEAQRSGWMGRDDD
jgi:glycosyltransferase involved in cell wall biosynthesis